MRRTRLGAESEVTVVHALEPSPKVVLPEGPGPHPAVVIGAEAWGINEFADDVQRRLAELGFASVVPDYYHGDSPSGVNYEDFTEVIEYIGKLDFTCGARDLAAAVDLLKQTPEVDADRIAMWGYCTGGTLAWLAACQRGDLAATVLFFPSQPYFDELGPRTPAHPMDLLWQITSPLLMVYGDQDSVMPPLEDLTGRIEQWGVDAEIEVYPGAGHAFTSPDGPMRHDEADRLSWERATAFLGKHLA